MADLIVTMPPALGGPGGAPDPEQLFAAAYATCFRGALRLVAKNRGVSVPDGAIANASISLAPDDTSFGIDAASTAHLPASSRPRTRCAPTPRPPAATSAWSSRRPSDRPCNQAGRNQAGRGQARARRAKSISVATWRIVSSTTRLPWPASKRLTS